MPATHPDPNLTPHLSWEFVTTNWSTILLAGGVSSEQADMALDNLCRDYWYPLYAYVRRQGHDVPDAQDLTQSFFARLLEKKHLRLAEPARGRFRTFLLCSLKHFLINDWEKTRTTKRGGSHTIFSLDEQTAEGRYRTEPVDNLTPESIYDKRWAATLLEKVLIRLRESYAAEEKERLFEELKPYVWGEQISEGYEEIASRLGVTGNALRVAMHRLRELFRKLLRDEVARTVASPGDVDEELRHLVVALRS